MRNDLSNQMRKMNSNRRTAIIVGVLILAAYSVLGSLFTESITIMVLLESISGAVVIALVSLLIGTCWKQREIPNH